MRDRHTGIVWLPHPPEGHCAIRPRTYRGLVHDAHAACAPENDAQRAAPQKGLCYLPGSANTRGSSDAVSHRLRYFDLKLWRCAPGEAQGHDPAAQAGSPVWRKHGDTGSPFADSRLWQCPAWRSREIPFDERPALPLQECFLWSSSSPYRTVGCQIVIYLVLHVKVG